MGNARIPLRTTADVELDRCATIATMSSGDGQLFWSKRGDVACAKHAPAKDDPAWAREQWTALPSRRRYRIYQCRTCYGSPVSHKRRARES